MPKHSIIVPHANRDKHLAVCLMSIHNSAEVCGLGWDDYLITVVGEMKPPFTTHHTRFIAAAPYASVDLGPNEPAPFYKTRLLNIGIEAAHGDTFTFLDADAVVGPLFFENLTRLEDDTLTKLAYRVRYAPYCEWPGEWADRFVRYDSGRFGLAFEAYGAAERDCSQGSLPPSADMAVFGNSQMSIRRDKLGDLRFDKRYIGRGYEDLSFNRAIAEAHGAAYRCEIVTDGPHAMFHIKHNHVAGFDASPWNSRNRRLFYSEAKTWFVCPDVATAEHTRAQDSRAEVVWSPNDKWLLSRAIQGLDEIIHVDSVKET